MCIRDRPCGIEGHYPLDVYWIPPREEEKMRVMRFILASLGVVGLISVAALAQEGHPLKGSWLGDFGPNKTTRTQVFLVMDWDGKAISGVINPGTDNIPIKNAMLTPPTPPPPTCLL